MWYMRIWSSSIRISASVRYIATYLCWLIWERSRSFPLSPERITLTGGPRGTATSCVSDVSGSSTLRAREFTTLWILQVRTSKERLLITVPDSSACVRTAWKRQKATLIVQSSFCFHKNQHPFNDLLLFVFLFLLSLFHVYKYCNNIIFLSDALISPSKIPLYPFFSYLVQIFSYLVQKFLTFFTHFLCILKVFSDENTFS